MVKRSVCAVCIAFKVPAAPSHQIAPHLALPGHFHRYRASMFLPPYQSAGRLKLRRMRLAPHPSATPLPSSAHPLPAFRSLTQAFSLIKIIRSGSYSGSYSGSNFVRTWERPKSEIQQSYNRLARGDDGNKGRGTRGRNTARPAVPSSRRRSSHRSSRRDREHGPLFPLIPPP